MGFRLQDVPTPLRGAWGLSGWWGHGAGTARARRGPGPARGRRSYMVVIYNSRTCVETFCAHTPQPGHADEHIHAELLFLSRTNPHVHTPVCVTHHRFLEASSQAEPTLQGGPSWRGSGEPGS